MYTYLSSVYPWYYWAVFVYDNPPTENINAESSYIFIDVQVIVDANSNKTVVVTGIDRKYSPNKDILNSFDLSSLSTD